MSGRPSPSRSATFKSSQAIVLSSMTWDFHGEPGESGGTYSLIPTFFLGVRISPADDDLIGAEPQEIRTRQAVPFAQIVGKHAPLPWSALAGRRVDDQGIAMPGFHRCQETARTGLPHAHLAGRTLAPRGDRLLRPAVALAAEQGDSLQPAQQDVLVAAAVPMHHVEVVGDVHGVVDQMGAPLPVGIGRHVVGQDARPAPLPFLLPRPWRGTTTSWYLPSAALIQAMRCTVGSWCNLTGSQRPVGSWGRTR